MSTEHFNFRFILVFWRRTSVHGAIYEVAKHTRESIYRAGLSSPRASARPRPSARAPARGQAPVMSVPSRQHDVMTIRHLLEPSRPRPGR